MKQRILIIDDEPEFTRLMKFSLEAAGYYHVREENDPKRAIEAARDFVPDVVILDVMMPWRNGKDIAEQLQADADLRLASTPIVFLTALAVGNETVAELVGHVYLPKGSPMETIIDCFEKLLAHRRAQRPDRAGERQLLELKLANLRSNRQACQEANRSGFDLLIEKTLRALAELDARE